MKMVLVDDDEMETSGASFFERIGSLVNALKNALPRLAATRSPTPWQSGYNAFYESGTTNPHEAGTNDHQVWSDGHEAARDAFEW